MWQLTENEAKLPRKQRITKFFNTLGKAEAYQNQLYSQYDHVLLVSAPRFTESGNYTWEVK